MGSPGKDTEWVAIPFSRGSSQPRDRTQLSCAPALAGRSCTTVPPGKPLETRYEGQTKENKRYIKYTVDTLNLTLYFLPLGEK